MSFSVAKYFICTDDEFAINAKKFYIKLVQSCLYR